jgi:hypothetical protein
MSRVLIGYSACPLTRAAFEAAGHECWTCDLLPARGDANGRHLQCDIWEALLSHRWDFGVLHPMCTYLTCSAAWAYGDGPYHQKVKPGTLVGAERRAARDEAIDNFRRLLALPFPVVCENPATSFLSKAIRPPDQIIHPHQFGDDASKATGLWKSPEVPDLVHTQHVAPRMVEGRPRWANQTDSGQNRLSPSETRWLERSATYPGIAAAMGAQWGAWLSGRATKAIGEQLSLLECA